jgi:UDP:flavonoid glycosyltransferase YjiC (YdhE family)
MICIPISADQPLVSYRVADDLGLGIRLDLVEFTLEDVHMSLHRIFDDEQFYVRCDRLSKISHEYPGYANGAKLIMDLLEENSN